MRGSYFDRLEEELVAAAARQNRELQQAAERRPQRLRFGRLLVPAAGGVAAAAAVAAALVVVVLLSPPSAEASSVTVRRSGDVVTIAVVHRGASPSEVLADLAEEDVAAAVAASPTGPSRVGDLLGLRATGAGITTNGPYQLTVPAGWPGRVEVRAGVAAAAGERYEVSTDAFAAGERFACLAPGVAAGVVRDVAAEVGVRVVWRAADASMIEEPPPDVAVAELLAVSDREVVARLGEARGANRAVVERRAAGSCE